MARIHSRSPEWAHEKALKSFMRKSFRSSERRKGSVQNGQGQLPIRHARQIPRKENCAQGKFRARKIARKANCETHLKKVQPDRKENREHPFLITSEISIYRKISFQGSVKEALEKRKKERKKERRKTWKKWSFSCVLPSETEGHHSKITTDTHGEVVKKAASCEGTQPKRCARSTHGWKTKSALEKRRMDRKNGNTQNTNPSLCDLYSFQSHRDLLFYTA